jgi:hypothetical protein
VEHLCDPDQQHVVGIDPPSPNLANLKRLCKALDLTADALITRAGELEKELSKS